MTDRESVIEQAAMAIVSQMAMLRAVMKSCGEQAMNDAATPRVVDAARDLLRAVDSAQVRGERCPERVLIVAAALRARLAEMEAPHD
jgi:hypothetical protein